MNNNFILSFDPLFILNTDLCSFLILSNLKMPGPQTLCVRRLQILFNHHYLCDIVFIWAVVTSNICRHLELGLHKLRLSLWGTEAVRVVVWSATWWSNKNTGEAVKERKKKWTKTRCLRKTIISDYSDDIRYSHIYHCTISKCSNKINVLSLVFTFCAQCRWLWLCM